MINDLRAAIDERRLVLHFQPTLDVASNKVRGLEALVRWPHPERGLLYPDSFIALAERVGLITDLTRLVLDLAISEAAELRKLGHDLQMSVNITRHDLLDGSLGAYVQGLLLLHHVPCDKITLEITESCLGDQPEQIALCIADLRQRGIQISIDDFGVGYSSMSQLLGLVIDELKIDKSFVLSLLTDSRAEAIVRSTIELGRALDLTIVAEGVETAEILTSLQGLGTDVAQGYGIARPLNRIQLGEFLARRDGDLSRPEDTSLATASAQSVFWPAPTGPALW